jgi:ABC-2 type transport system ATP-binding protein
MISVRHLTKWYGETRAAHDVSFDVARGEIVGLLGRNGAGKTTVMKVLTGYLEPTSGTCIVDDADVLTERQVVQRHIGYLPENAPSYPEMLVQDYLVMMAELRGVPADAVTPAVVRAARDTGLVDRLTSPIATLSKGYRQRVGLAQAIVHDPQVLVLDEPTNGLDPVQIVEIRALIRRLAERSTVILSTHILSEIEALCDRVVMLIDGEVAADAPLAELRSSRRVRISLPAAVTDPGAALTAVAGVSAVAAAGPDPRRGGFTLWHLECSVDPAPVPAIVRAAGAAGWEIGEVAAETASLEAVFRARNEAAVARRRADAQPAPEALR